MKYKVTLTGFASKEQAAQWINWYDGQGEQTEGLENWITNVSAVYVSGNTKEHDDGWEQEVTVYYKDEDEWV